MIETIFFILIVSLFVAIIGYVMYSINAIKCPRDNNQVDALLKKCNHQLINSINPKLQQVINEAKEKRIASKLRFDISWKEIVNIEKERLLKDDWIYNKIGKSLLYADHCNLFKENNDYKRFSATFDAINLIPGLRAESKLNGKMITIYIEE
jgi:hypothetical protein